MQCQLLKDALEYSIGIDGIFFLNANQGWAVNDYRIIVTGDGGETWSLQPADYSGNIYDVYFHDANNGWTAGNRILLYTNDGGITWQSHNMGDQTPGLANVTSFMSIAAISPSVAIAVVNHSVGDRSDIVRTEYGGTTWNSVYSSIEGKLYDIQFANSNHGWIVGASGIILYTADSGVTWVREESRTNQTLKALCVGNTNHRWVVGSNGAVLDSVSDHLYDSVGDGDVDGADLAAFLRVYSATELPAFALEFGHVYCIP